MSITVDEEDYGDGARGLGLALQMYAVPIAIVLFMIVALEVLAVLALVRYLKSTTPPQNARTLVVLGSGGPERGVTVQWLCTCMQSVHAQRMHACRHARHTCVSIPVHACDLHMVTAFPTRAHAAVRTWGPCGMHVAVWLLCWPAPHTHIWHACEARRCASHQAACALIQVGTLPRCSSWLRH